MIHSIVSSCSYQATDLLVRLSSFLCPDQGPTDDFQRLILMTRAIGVVCLIGSQNAKSPSAKKEVVRLDRYLHTLQMDKSA